MLCGLSESELCSPLVVSQSRAEHDASVAIHTRISESPLIAKVSSKFLSAARGHTHHRGNDSFSVGKYFSLLFKQVNLQCICFVELKFTYRGRPIGPAEQSYPNFPPVSSAEGFKLMELYSSMGQSPIIAHQLCALQLFQARMNRNRYAIDYNP